jgi:hypothetical protein
MQDNHTMTKHKDYTIQPACMNCTKVFQWYDHDDPNQYYCNKDNNRPACSSTIIDPTPDAPPEAWENDEHPHWEMIRQRSEQWQKWSEEYKVQPCGTCPEYQKDTDNIWIWK